MIDLNYLISRKWQVFLVRIGSRLSKIQPSFLPHQLLNDSLFNFIL